MKKSNECSYERLAAGRRPPVAFRWRRTLLLATHALVAGRMCQCKIECIWNICLKKSTYICILTHTHAHTHAQSYCRCVAPLLTNTNATAGNCVALKESEVAPNRPVIATFGCRHNNNNTSMPSLFRPCSRCTSPSAQPAWVEGQSSWQVQCKADVAA